MGDELVDGEPRVVAYVCHALPHRGHALALQLLLRHVEGLRQVVEGGVEQQRVVQNAAPANAVVCAAGHLAPANEYVVAPRPFGVHAHRAQHGSHCFHVPWKGRFNVAGVGDVRKLHAAHVGIDASAAALAPEDVYAVGTAVVCVHLALHELVATKHHRGFHAPDEEIVVVGIGVGHILLDRKIEWEQPRPVGLG